MTSIELLGTIRENGNSYTTVSKKKVCELDTDVKALKEHIDEFKKNVKNLKNYSSGATIKSKVERHLKKIVKSYNELTKKSGKITDKELNKQLSKIDELFSDNEKDLRKIGLRKEDGKLRLDSEIFEKAEDKDIDKLFTGKSSFIKKLDKIMNTVSEYADDAEYNSVVHKMSRTTHYSEEDMNLASSFALTDEIVQVMNLHSKLAYEGTSDSDNNQSGLSEEELKNDLELFSQFAYKNEWIDLDKTATQAKIKQLCEANGDILEKLGITIDEDGNMSFENKTIDDDFIDTFVSLFGADAPFGKAIQDFCKDGFHQIIDPKKLGVSLIDMYV